MEMRGTITGVDELNAMLASYAEKFPAKFPALLRRAGVYVCRSMKARTPKATKTVKGEAYVGKSANAAPWLTYDSRHVTKDGPWKTRAPKFARPLRRWYIHRRPGTEAQTKKDYYVYGDQSPARQAAELIRLHGRIFHAGLAKQSWGWVAHEIYSGESADLTWKRRKRDVRNPKDDVKAHSRQFSTGTDRGFEIAINNHLDYIGKIVPEAQVEAATSAASASLAFNLTREMDRIIRRRSAS